MKKPINKYAFILATALVVGLSSAVSAHDRLNETLGAALGATDYFRVTCFNDGTGNAGHVEVQIKDDNVGTNVLSAVVFKNSNNGTYAATTTDVTGANGVYSPLVNLVNGVNGVYNVFVHKKIAGTRKYDLSAWCKTGTVLYGGNITGTVISAPLQNQ